MPLLRNHPLSAARRAPKRHAGPSCRGGASSMLRIGQPAMTIVPMARALAQRIATQAARQDGSA